MLFFLSTGISRYSFVAFLSVSLSFSHSQHRTETCPKSSFGSNETLWSQERAHSVVHGPAATSRMHRILQNIAPSHGIVLCVISVNFLRNFRFYSLSLCSFVFCVSTLTFCPFLFLLWLLFIVTISSRVLFLVFYTFHLLFVLVRLLVRLLLFLLSFRSHLPTYERRKTVNS